MTSWWRKDQKRVQRFAKRVAIFHTISKDWPNTSQAQLNEHRSMIVSDIVKTANTLQLVAKYAGDVSPKIRGSHLFSRLFALRAAILISQYQNDRFQNPLSKSQTRELAIKAKNMHKLDEKAKRVEKQKLNGEVRPTYEFGPIRYAQQITLKWIIEASIELSKFDFGLPGRGGIHGAARKIEQELKKGTRFWVTTDIKSAYPSITKGHFRPHLDLGKKIERYVVFPHLPESSLLTSNTTANEPACRRLPQGAAHAPFVLSAVVDGCLRSVLPSDVIVIVYADNIAIGAQSIEGAKCAFFAIQKAFTDLPRGLTLHETKLCDGFQHSEGGINQSDSDFKYFHSIDFCGYRLSLDQFTGAVRIRPSGAAWQKFWKRIELELISNSTPWEAGSQLIDEKFHNWKTGFHLWQPNPISLELFETSKAVMLTEFSKQ